MSIISQSDEFEKNLLKFQEDNTVLQEQQERVGDVKKALEDGLLSVKGVLARCEKIPRRIKIVFRKKTRPLIRKAHRRMVDNPV